MRMLRLRERTACAINALENASGGVRDAAQFQYETGLDAAVLAYSWPSAHDLLKYAVDEDSNSASSNNFVQFVGPLKAAAARARVRMMIVAHSMGNRIA